jgi:hypothetical protein
VAQVKQARSMPVTDAKREAELLDAMERLGAESGLPAAEVRAFFSGQISAAKLCQEEWLKRHAGVKPLNQAVADLGTTVSPALDALGRKMIRALAAPTSPEERSRWAGVFSSAAWRCRSRGGGRPG